MKRQKVTYKGTTYDSLSHLFNSKKDEAAVKYGCFTHRVREGIDIETALTNPRQGGLAKFGGTQKSVRESKEGREEDKLTYYLMKKKW